jgi:hypothetical protein
MRAAARDGVDGGYGTYNPRSLMGRSQSAIESAERYLLLFLQHPSNTCEANCNIFVDGESWDYGNYGAYNPRLLIRRS